MLADTPLQITSTAQLGEALLSLSACTHPVAVGLNINQRMAQIELRLLAIAQHLQAVEERRWWRRLCRLCGWLYRGSASLLHQVVQRWR